MSIGYYKINGVARRRLWAYATAVTGVSQVRVRIRAA